MYVNSNANTGKTNSLIASFKITEDDELYSGSV